MAPTFFITDRRMLQHKCEWDQHHLEKPERLSAILDLLEKEGIPGQCEQLESRECTLDELRLVHSHSHIEAIRNASGLPELEQMEAFCAVNEDIYVNAHSWESALLSAGCALEATEAVLSANKSKSGTQMAPNAFALIRPPGHHASADSPCGFCLFNNVAICAKKARMLGIQRVLILDWDIHAGQGTQYCIEGDPGIRLISAHRFEEGQFWPELPESGIVQQYKNTINVPLDETGFGDAEYAAMMHFLVLPLVYQWQPELILISCGFDAALGDPEGEMEVTPAGFGYMTGLLARLGIPLCLLLEGGYFVPMVAQCALHCMNALLQKAPPLVEFCERPASPQFLRTLFSVLLANSQQFGLFNNAIQMHNQFRLRQSMLPNLRRRRHLMPLELEMTIFKYKGERNVPMPNPTRNVYSPRPAYVEEHFQLRLKQLVEAYKERQSVKRDQLELNVCKGRIQIFSAKPKEFLCELDAQNREQFLLIYFYLLLPLAFTCFDIRFDTCSNIVQQMDWKQLKQIIERLPPAANTENIAKAFEDGVCAFIDVFPMMKPFFFF